MRAEVKCPKGSKIRGIQKKHVHKVVKSRAHENVIGHERGVKVWGWLASASAQRKISLKLATEWTNEWIGEREHEINALRADAVWEENPLIKIALDAKANCAEAKGAVLTWMLLNEERPKGDRNYQVLRLEKREALRSARQNLFKKMGGTEAMYAAIALLTLEGLVVMESDRGVRGTRGKETACHNDWVERSFKWATAANWIDSPVEEMIIQATEKQQIMRESMIIREGIGEMKILDVGEGWGSIGIAASQVPGCATIGVDRAGFLDQGDKYGEITSRIQLDLCSNGSANVLRRACKLASRSLESFLMVWLSPECRILTAANAMNVGKHCTNGKMLTDPRNCAMPKEVLEAKQEEYAQCLTAIDNQMTALEEESDLIKFALENPKTSDLWNLPSVVKAIERNPSWRLVPVDQCAYGRKCKKPTMILTNLNWKPEGMTKSGRCIIGKCGGTKNNPAGPNKAKHQQQMITSDPARKPREGKLVGKGHRREYSVPASKNLVSAELVMEIIQAAILEKELEKGKGTKRKRAQ